MSEKSVDRLLLGVFFFAWLFIAFAFGVQTGTKWEQEKAIEAGVGFWTIDPETAEERFVYDAPPGVPDCP